MQVIWTRCLRNLKIVRSETLQYPQPPPQKLAQSQQYTKLRFRKTMQNHDFPILLRMTYKVKLFIMLRVLGTMPPELVSLTLCSPRTSLRIFVGFFAPPYCRISLRNISPASRFSGSASKYCAQSSEEKAFAYR